MIGSGLKQIVSLLDDGGFLVSPDHMIGSGLKHDVIVKCLAKLRFSRSHDRERIETATDVPVTIATGFSRSHDRERIETSKTPSFHPAISVSPDHMIGSGLKLWCATSHESAASFSRSHDRERIETWEARRRVRREPFLPIT